MGLGFSWFRIHPEFRQHGIAAETARSAAMYAMLAAVSRGTRSWLRHSYRKAKHLRMRRATIRELERLSDGTLKDLGVSRGEIWEIADNLAAAAIEATAAADQTDGEEGPPPTAGIASADAAARLATANVRSDGRKRPADRPRPPEAAGGSSSYSSSSSAGRGALSFENTAAGS